VGVGFAGAHAKRDKTANAASHNGACLTEIPVFVSDISELYYRFKDITKRRYLSFFVLP